MNGTGGDKDRGDGGQPKNSDDGHDEKGSNEQDLQEMQLAAVPFSISKFSGHPWYNDNLHCQI